MKASPQTKTKEDLKMHISLRAVITGTMMWLQFFLGRIAGLPGKDLRFQNLVKDRLARGRGCFQILARQVEEREKEMFVSSSSDVCDHQLSAISSVVSGQCL